METPVERLNLAALGKLEFVEADTDRFPALRLAREAMEQGGAAPIVLNAANEVAVEAFLARRIRFGEIPRLVAQALQHSAMPAVQGIDHVIAIDTAVRAAVEREVESVCS
jgi:1-deoxy-D-xylulose-5-phosphate reductoisomerase